MLLDWDSQSGFCCKLLVSLIFPVLNCATTKFNQIAKLASDSLFFVVVLIFTPGIMSIGLIIGIAVGATAAAILVISLVLTTCCKRSPVLPWKREQYVDIDKANDGVYVQGTGDITVEKTHRNHTNINSSKDVLVTQTGNGSMTVNSQGSAFVVGKGVDPKHAAIIQNAMTRASATRSRLQNE